MVEIVRGCGAQIRDRIIIAALKVMLRMCYCGSRSSDSFKDESIRRIENKHQVGSYHPGPHKNNVSQNKDIY